MLCASTATEAASGVRGRSVGPREPPPRLGNRLSERPVPDSMTPPEAVPPTKFDEGRTYLVSDLHVLDVEGTHRVVQDVAVVFTPGWLFVQEADRDGYVLPRDRVLRVEGIKSPR